MTPYCPSPSLDPPPPPIWAQGTRNEVFVDVVERLTVVIAANVSGDRDPLSRVSPPPLGVSPKHCPMSPGCFGSAHCPQAPPHPGTP